MAPDGLPLGVTLATLPHADVHGCLTIGEASSLLSKSFEPLP